MNFQAVFTHVDKKAYHWTVIINGEAFTYSMGLGHAKSKQVPNITLRVEVSKLDMETKVAIIRGLKFGRVSHYDWEMLHNIYPVIPKQDEVLNSLFLDASCGLETFNDFCDNCGYDKDSIKALEIYRACQVNYEKLRKALGQEYNNEKSRIETLEL